MTDVQSVIQGYDLAEAEAALRSALAVEEEHPHIAGIGRGKNMRRWWIEQALDAVKKARLDSAEK